jgi:ABC-type nitrate/sulfonate/bicarbonate transport system permease component
VTAPMSSNTDLVDAPTADPAAPGPATPPRETRTHLLQLLCFVAVIALWALISALHLISDTALPSPFATAGKFVDLLGQDDFWDAVGATLRDAVVGLLAAAVVGIPLGLVTGTYAAAEESSRLLVDFLRSFPVIALLPVFLLLLGSTPSMKQTVVFIACVFPVFLQAQYGARSVQPTIAETVRAYRIPRLLRFRRVILPSATPSIMTGLRLAATTSVLVAIGVEILTTLPGIGHEVTQEQQSGNSDAAFAFIFTAAILGYGINRASMFMEKSLLRWRPPAHQG